MMSLGTALSANQNALLDAIQQLGQLRRNTPALQRGALATLWVDDTTYVYTRTEGANVAIVTLNVGDSPRDLSLPIASDAWQGRTLRTGFGPDPIEPTLGETLELRLPARSMAVYTLE